MDGNRRACRALLLSLGLLAVGSGCTPGPGGPLEEQKEPHYRVGKARVNSMDYTGAVEAFHRALEVNPRSASAHFELGWLYDVKVPDPAAAIYHYQRYLQLRPRADNADIVRQRILACKQELARTVLPLPISPSLQREFEQLAEENRRLKADLARWQGYATDLTRALSNAVALSQPPAGPAPASPRGELGVAREGTGARAPAADFSRASLGGSTSPSPLPPSVWRLHEIQPGETLSRIARRYGVSLQAILEANPGVDPHRLRVGQKIRVPAP